VSHPPRSSSQSHPPKLLNLISIAEHFSKSTVERRRRGNPLYGVMEGAEQVSLAGRLIAQELRWDHADPTSRSESSPAQIILANRTLSNRKVDCCATARLAPSPARRGSFLLSPSQKSENGTAARANSRLLLQNDVAAILCYYRKAAPPNTDDFRKKLVCDLDEIATLADTWVAQSVVDTARKAKVATALLRDKTTYDTLRGEISEVAEELDKIFRDIVNDVLDKPHLTGRRVVKPLGDTLVECAKACLRRPGVRDMLMPLLGAQRSLKADNTREDMMSDAAEGARAESQKKGRARRRGLSIVKLCLGMIPFMQMIHIGNKSLLNHFGLVYGEVLRSFHARDVLIDALSLSGLSAPHQTLNNFEKQYTKAVARVLKQHLVQDKTLRLCIVADNAVLTVNHSSQTANRSSSDQIDATALVALLVRQPPERYSDEVREPLAEYRPSPVPSCPARLASLLFASCSCSCSCSCPFFSSLASLRPSFAPFLLLSRFAKRLPC
jgi:hypothetical protein